MDDIGADNANKKPKKNTIQKLSLLRSFKPLLGRLHSHADCHNRTLHYKELLKLYIPEVIMPKKGKKNQSEQAEESGKSFQKLKAQALSDRIGYQSFGASRFG